jgi:hypothetical protein
MTPTIQAKSQATQTLLAIGTRKGLWLARSDDRKAWTLEGPHFLMSEIPSVCIDTRGRDPGGCHALPRGHRGSGRKGLADHP